MFWVVVWLSMRFALLPLLFFAYFFCLPSFQCPLNSTPYRLGPISRSKYNFDKCLWFTKYEAKKKRNWYRKMYKPLVYHSKWAINRIAITVMIGTYKNQTNKKSELFMLCLCTRLGAVANHWIVKTLPKKYCPTRQVLSQSNGTRDFPPKPNYSISN